MIIRALFPVLTTTPIDLTSYHSGIADQILCLEYVQLCKAVAIGFAVMGFIGYFVKLIHIPM